MSFKDDALERQIPYYLTGRAKECLKEAIKAFSESSQYHGFYLRSLHSDPLQGDCVSGVSVFNKATGETKQIAVLALSNTCDMSQANKRIVPMRVVVCPVIKLKAYEAMLRKGHIQEERIAGQIASIKKQEITNIFYLPYCDALGDELIVMLDDVASISLQALEQGKRLFSLAQFGFYLFLFKLSVHFCRFHEEVNRFEE